jgi:hypothetical protein
MKFLDFFLFLWVILPSWIRIRIPDSESGSGSTDLTESRSEPDPKHWLKEEIFKNIRRYAEYLQAAAGSVCSWAYLQILHSTEVSLCF